MTTSIQQQLWEDGPGAPLSTPFREDESIDYEALAAQAIRMAKANVGIVLLGTNGEAFHLTAEERVQCIRKTRSALDAAGYQHVPLMAGTGMGSAASTIEATKQAAEAGASHCMVICPAYFSFVMGRNSAAIHDFFTRVLDASPIPVMLYNFPAAAGGIDLNSDDIIQFAQHPRCFGVKLTCMMINKAVRIGSYTQSPEYLAKHGDRLRKYTRSGRFQINPGGSDVVLGALASHCTGCITGLVNVLPKTVRRLYDLAVAGLEGDREAWNEASRLQDRVSDAEWVLFKAGFQGTKAAIDKYVGNGLGGYARSPLPGLAPQETRLEVATRLQDIWAFEESL